MNRISPDLLSHYISFLEQVLTPNRLKHSFGVMQMMAELTDIYCLDPEKAVIAGLLHDAGKDLARAQQQVIIAEAGC